MNRTLPDDNFDTGAAISPDGNRLYTSTPLTAYDVASGTAIFSKPKLAYAGVDVTPDGKRLALGGDIATGEADLDPGDVLLLDAATGNEQRRLPGHGEEIVTVLLSHNGKRLVSTSAELTAKVWDVRTGRVVEEIQLGEASLQGVGFSPDDETLYTANDRALRSWDLIGSHRYLEQISQPSPGGSYGCIAPAPRGESIFRQGPAGIWFINVETHEATPPASGGTGGWWVTDTSNCVNFSPRGDRAATVRSGVIRIWNTQTGQVVVRRDVPGAKAGPGGHVVPGANVIDLDFSGRDGSRIVIGQESGLATMLDATTLKQVGKSVQVGDSITWLSAGPDNRTVAVLTGGKKVTGGLQVPNTGWALLDLEAGKVIRTGKLPIRTPEVIAFSPNGRHAAITSPHGEVLVLDTVTGTPVRPPTLQHQGANALAYTTTGALLVAPGTDGAVSLYAGDTGAPLGTIVVPNRTGINVAFQSDDHTVLITSYDDAIYRWDTHIKHAITFACQMAGRDMTQAEWQDNFRDRPYRNICP